MEISFHNKRALVTGAGKGIGKELAKQLASCGAQVFAISRTQDDLDILKNENAAIETICVDLSDWTATVDAVRRLGPIDLLVNNAGIALLQPFLETSPEAFEKIMNVNVKSVMAVSQVVAKGMIERGTGGSIVNVSSQASEIGLTYHTAYCASKGALNQLTRVMALELGPHQIRVNCVLPTVVMTDMGVKHWSDPVKAKPMLSRIPLGHFAAVKDVVEPILYLLSDKASMINGVMLPIDGGLLAT